MFIMCVRNFAYLAFTCEEEVTNLHFPRQNPVMKPVTVLCGHHLGPAISLTVKHLILVSTHGLSDPAKRSDLRSHLLYLL